MRVNQLLLVATALAWETSCHAGLTCEQQAAAEDYGCERGAADGEAAGEADGPTCSCPFLDYANQGLPATDTGALEACAKTDSLGCVGPASNSYRLCFAEAYIWSCADEARAHGCEQTCVVR